MELPSTLVFDYPTVTALAAFLASRVGQLSDAASGDAADAGSDAGTVRWPSDDEGSLGSLGMVALDAAPQLRLVGASEVVSRSAGDALLSPKPADLSRPIPVERWDVEAQAELAGALPVQVSGGAADASSSSGCSPQPTTKHAARKPLCLLCATRPADLPPHSHSNLLPYPPAVWRLPGRCVSV